MILNITRIKSECRLAVALQPVRMERINSACGFIRPRQSYLSSSLYKILNKSGPFLPNTAAAPATRPNAVRAASHGVAGVRCQASARNFKTDYS
jgi:hypothetical protein